LFTPLRRGFLFRSGHWLATAFVWTVDDMAMATPVEEQALRYASARVGGDESLADRLGATPEMLQAWMYDGAELPDDKLLALVDLLLAETAPDKD
jgi:hypothetical protein